MDERSTPRPRAQKLDRGLSSTDAFVLSRIDGTLTLEEVGEVTGLPIDAVLAIARRLESVGAIEVPAPVAKNSRNVTAGRYATHVAKTKTDGAPLDSVPRRTSRDLRSLELESDDAFLLASVDGMFTVEDLAEIVGLDAQRVALRVRALVEAGALVLGDGKSSKKRATQRPEAKRPSPPSKRPSPPTKRPNAPTQRPAKPPSKRPSPPSKRPSPVPVLAAERVDDSCELPPDVCARIDAALNESQHHYETLGVKHTATAKEIQRAYFALASSLHPDRHFGKKLGPYKQKIDLVIRRAAAAYEVLRLPNKRAEYDASLKFEVPVAVPAPPPAPDPPPPAPPAPPPILSTIDERPKADATGRRFAAKLKSTQILEAAQQALAKGDAAAAANHYRLALHYADDDASRAYAESGLREARGLLVDTHLKKALQEERENRWSDAVVSYGKALEGRPDDPSICERLANALRNEPGDLQRAAQLAELAVSRAPRRAAYRVTLGMIYAETGARERAIEQLETAASLDPADEATARMLQTLQKRRR